MKNSEVINFFFLTVISNSELTVNVNIVKLRDSTGFYHRHERSLGKW